ncbi:MAG: tetratricopeptide repeat protein [Burkholderiales bacterium]|nr:tetratricopeptide repeat protein [Burkholderiales bacterium]ODU70426.1 MAG: hypothetical protein ABT05_01620 [Lautropia sp. SCN 66-9]
MLKHKNAHGLVFTCSNHDAVEAYDRTLRRYVAFDRQTGAEMKAMLALDPEMPMGRLLRGCFLMLMGVGALVGKARTEADAVMREVAVLEPREALHAEALAAWTGGSLRKATSIWTSISMEWPKDVLALKLANFGAFYMGQSRMIRDVPAAALDHWQPAEYEYSYLLSLHAFGLEECGQYRLAESAGRRALDLNPNDPWAVHAVAHVLEAAGRADEGIDWVAGQAGHWGLANNFRYHIAWHQTLFHYEKGDLAGALDAYDRLVYSDQAVEYLDICNDASMLLRLEMAGADVGGRWVPVAEKVAARGLDLVMSFPDVHFLLALCSSGDKRHRGIAEALAAQMDDFAVRSACDDADAYRRVGVGLGRAILHFRDGHYGDAARLLMEVEAELPAIGGSHAQRDLFRELTAECLWREAPQSATTASYLARATYSRPADSRNWSRYIESLDGAAARDAAMQRRAR